MNRLKILLLSALAALLVPVAQAQTRGSSAYALPMETLDAGGGRGTISGHVIDASLGGLGGPVLELDGSNMRPGYCGQLYDFSEIRITPPLETLNEGSGLQFHAAAICDDGTVLPTAAGGFTWRVSEGLNAPISSNGIISLPAIWTQTNISVQAQYGSFTGIRAIQVLNVFYDNYGAYANDLIADDWQIQYFGFADTNAAPTADHDGDGLNNRTEFSRGLDPTRADTDGDGQADGTDPTPAGGALASRGTPDYTILTDTLDTGGRGGFAWDYCSLNSGSGIEGAVFGVRDYTHRPGFLGQLEDPIFPAANLAVHLAARPNFIGEGMSFSNLLTVTNFGPEAAPNVTVTFAMPAGAGLSSVTGNCTRQGDVLTWNLGTMVAGGSANLEVLMTSAASGDRLASATVHGDAADPDSANNTSSVTTRVVPVAFITVNTSVAAADTTSIENKYVVVNPGIMLTVSGQHRLAMLTVAGTVTHPLLDTNGVNLVVDGLFEVQAGGNVDVTGKGYQGTNYSNRAQTRGTNGEPTTEGGAYWAAGSYGSLGAGVSPNALYGSEDAPVDLGSGGAGSPGWSGAFGGNGGGRIQIEAGEMIVNGQVLADGMAGNFSGGSGGSVYLILRGGTFSGSGIIRAAGGEATDVLAGGGGRIAITGYGANTFGGTLGRAGTVYLRPQGEEGDLILDRTFLTLTNGEIRTYHSILTTTNGTSIITNRGTINFSADQWTVPGGLVLYQEGVLKGLGRSSNYLGSMTIASNAMVTHTPLWLGGAQLAVAGRLEIQAGGKVDVTGKGYLGSNYNNRAQTQGTNGEPATVGGAYDAGGSYGSLGAGQSPNVLYGSEAAPVDLGSGGGGNPGWSGGFGGNGGGCIQIEAGEMIVNGQVLADGTAGNHSGGSGGSIYLSLRGGLLSGNGTIRAAGGETNYSGGGGRIAITGYGANTFGGTLGRAGTVYLRPQGEEGDLILDRTFLTLTNGEIRTYHSILTTTNGTSIITNRGTINFSADQWTVPGGLVLYQEGVLKGLGRSSNYLGSLTIASNAMVTHTPLWLGGAQLAVAGRLEIQAGGKVDVTGKGYLGTNYSNRAQTRGTNGEPTTEGGAYYAAGSYGSLGAGVSPNALYGSEDAPVDLGSGGAGSPGWSGAFGGNGGGRIQIEAGEMIVNGQVLADGTAGNFSGGSGGSVYLILRGGTFIGSGIIRAAGGAATDVLAGGGGRIAVVGYAATNFIGTLDAGGGTTHWEPGGPLDSDGDGLPDDYEIAHGLDPRAATDANADSDGDGLTNRQEFLAGTDPQDGRSVLSLTELVLSGNGLQLQLSTVVGRRYRLEYRDSLSEGNWQVLIDNVEGTGQRLPLTDPAPSPEGRYYRVALIQ